jgi:hypothetical protein
MGNKITKEDLNWFGQFLRRNNSIKTLQILTEEPIGFVTRLEFCNKVLSLLNEGQFLEVKSIEEEGFFGMVNPNMDNYKKSTTIKSLCLSAYSTPSKLK